MSIFGRIEDAPSPTQALEAVAADLTQPRAPGTILRAATYRVAKPVPPWFDGRLAAMASFHGFSVHEAADFQMPDYLVFWLFNDRDPR